MVLPPPVSIHDRRVSFRNICHMFSSAFSSVSIPLGHLQWYVSHSMYVYLDLGYLLLLPSVSQINCHVLVIHYLVSYLTKAGKLLNNRVPAYPISILFPSIESLSCTPSMLLLIPKFIRSEMCLRTWVPYRGVFLSPSWESGPETNLSLGVFWDTWGL